MRFFVTGATGFIGSHFVQSAIRAGHSVLAVRRPSISAYQTISGLTWLDCELDALPKSSMDGCDALIHFAAVGVSPRQASRHELTRWNVGVPQSLMETAQRCGVRRIVMAGSFAEYGLSAEAYNLIPPDAPLLPISGYAASKAACFVACHAAAVELELEFCYLRIFSAFGDGQFESNFWPALKKAALAGVDFPMTAGEQIRDFVPVEDVVQVFLRAAVQPCVLPGQPFVCNVGSGKAVSIREFAEIWWDRWSAKGVLQIGALPYRQNEVMRFAPLIVPWPEARSGRS